MYSELKTVKRTVFNDNYFSRAKTLRVLYSIDSFKIFMYIYVS